MGDNTFSSRLTKGFLGFFKRNVMILVGLVLMMFIVTLFSDRFLTTANMLNILRQIVTNCFIAFGMTYCILIGGIDLSVGPMVAFSGVIAAYMLNTWNLPIPVCIIATLVVCALIGLFNGAMVTFTGIAPFIVTLSTQQIFRGFALLIAGGEPVRVNNDAFSNIGAGFLGPIAYPIIYCAIMFVICWILLNRTKFGRYVYAVGGNRTAAKYAGIKVWKVEILVYVLSAFLAGLAGVVLGCRMSAGVPATGEGYECDAIAAVVLGGSSFTGGIGTLGGTIIGCLVIGVINNGLNMINVSSFWQYVAKGVVILLAVFLDVMRKNSQGKKRKKAV